jgi:hypothetical protein
MPFAVAGLLKDPSSLSEVYEPAAGRIHKWPAAYASYALHQVVKDNRNSGQRL